MLTIQSFLLKFCNKRMGVEVRKNLKYAFLILAYAFIAVILVLKLDIFQWNQEDKTAEAFAAQKITIAMEEAPVLSEMEYLNLAFKDSSLLKRQSMNVLLQESNKQFFNNQYNLEAKDTIYRQALFVSADIYAGDLLANKVESEKKKASQTVKNDTNKKDKNEVAVAKKTSEAKAKDTQAKEAMNTGVAVLSLSSKEIEILQRIVEAEATGEDIKGKILVANVIMNRVNNSSFPDTVEEVVFQKTGGSYQFSPICDQRYYTVTVTKDTKEAVKRVIQGEDYSQGALYFSARKRASKTNMKWFDNNLKWLFQHGNHEFFTNK